MCIYVCSDELKIFIILECHLLRPTIVSLSCVTSRRGLSFHSIYIYIICTGVLYRNVVSTQYVSVRVSSYFLLVARLQENPRSIHSLSRCLQLVPSDLVTFLGGLSLLVCCRDEFLKGWQRRQFKTLYEILQKFGRFRKTGKRVFKER